MTYSPLSNELRLMMLSVSGVMSNILYSSNIPLSLKMTTAICSFDYEENFRVLPTSSRYTSNEERCFLGALRTPLEFFSISKLIGVSASIVCVTEPTDIKIKNETRYFFIFQLFCGAKVVYFFNIEKKMMFQYVSQRYFYNIAMLSRLYIVEC